MAACGQYAQRGLKGLSASIQTWFDIVGGLFLVKRLYTCCCLTSRMEWVLKDYKSQHALLTPAHLASLPIAAP